MEAHMPKGYSRLQIALHWIVFALIVLQYVLHDAIAEAWEAFEHGREIAFNPLVFQHVSTGILIAVLAFVRISVKMKRGAPALPEEEPALMKLAAKVTHLALYAFMILMPMSGAVAWFGGVENAAEAHEIMKPFLLALIALHVLGALYHQFVLKTNLMDRMRTSDKG